jgi:hypothetical protein
MIRLSDRVRRWNVRARFLYPDESEEVVLVEEEEEADLRRRRHEPEPEEPPELPGSLDVEFPLEPEPELVPFPDEEEPEIKEAIGGPGNVYDAPESKTFGSKMPGSESL